MNKKYFVIKNGDDEKVVKSYLIRNCGALYKDEILYLEADPTIRYFGTQGRFVSFCKNTSTFKRLRVLKAKVPALDGVYKKRRHRDNEKNIFYED